MSQQTRLSAVVQAFGADIKTLLAQDGNLSALTTTQKTSLVAAINEIKAALGTVIVNDAALNSVTTQTYSANKITALLATLKTDILGGAGAAYDTLLEIQNALQSEDSAINNILTALGFRVRFDAAQTLTAPQMVFACQNIGVGDPETDYVAIYNAAKV